MTATDPLSPFSNDLREYYFSAEPDKAPLDTIEFRHPAFVDDNGNPVAVRVVNDPEDLPATLEADAPMNAGEQVTFTRGAFVARKPESDSPGLPTFDLEVCNVSSILMKYLDDATTSTAPVQMSYRQYLSSDLSEPGVVIHGFTVKKANAGVVRVTATAGFEDYVNRPFPFAVYKGAMFHGLVR